MKSPGLDGTPPDGALPDGSPLLDGPLESTVARLREEYPDAYRAGRGGARIAEEVIKAALRHPGTPEEARGRRIAAEILAAAGEAARARELLDRLRLEGPAPADRGRAAYELGLDNLLRERPRTAARYLSLVGELDPGSPLAAVAGRLQPYFAIQASRSLPAFRASFTPGEGPAREIGVEDLKGRLAILHFWISTQPGEGGRVEELRRIAARLHARKIPAEVLGVNLDTDRSAFDLARRSLALTWPQHHDGLGFEGKLVRLLGLPRTPHFLALDSEGKVAYLGADVRLLEKALFPPASQGPAGEGGKAKER